MPTRYAPRCTVISPGLTPVGRLGGAFLHPQHAVLQLSDLGNGKGSYAHVPGSYINVVFPNGSNWLGLKARGDWSMARSHPWKSPRSKDVYWLHRKLSVPALSLELEISTLSEDNEVLVGPKAGNALYYDGTSSAEGTMAGEFHQRRLFLFHRHRPTI